ncbi:hypothetical protein MYX07_02620 [Patescibacteria group bacterium AH-259-L07]|nr:hypothetical protein [Patescibacteria group bacterium AH-259-L07]
MTTKNKKFVVTDEHKLALDRKRRELEKRFHDGVLNPRHVLNGLQFLVEGNRTKTFSYDDITAEWVQFYKKVFSIGVARELSDIQLPPKQKGIDRYIISTSKISTKDVFKKYQELCKAKIFQSSADILDKLRNDRKGAYVILVRDQVKPDMEYERLSARCLQILNVPGMTLKERMLADIKYGKETTPHRHLDIETKTLCTGSIYDNGYEQFVPSVEWCAGNPLIRFYKVDEGWNDLSTRKVIMVNSEPDDFPIEEKTLEMLLENENISKSEKGQVRTRLKKIQEARFRENWRKQKKSQQK